MQKLHFLAATAVILGTTACPTIDPLDDLGTSFTTVDTANDEIDTESGTSADTATTADTADTTADTTAGTTTDTTDGGCGGFGCDCVDSSTCDPGLECNGGICTQPAADTTDTTDTTDTGGGDPWDPAMCTAPSQSLMVGNLEGAFCSAPCMGSMDMSCPAGPQGTFAQCALTTMGATEPTFCALVCMVAQDACAPGSSCKDLMDAMNPGLGLCTYP